MMISTPVILSDNHLAVRQHVMQPSDSSPSMVGTPILPTPNHLEVLLRAIQIGAAAIQQQQSVQPRAIDPAAAMLHPIVPKTMINPQKQQQKKPRAAVTMTPTLANKLKKMGFVPTEKANALQKQQKQKQQKQKLQKKAANPLGVKSAAIKKATLIRTINQQMNVTQKAMDRLVAMKKRLNAAKTTKGSAATTGVQKSCGNCGRGGHNIRTCPCT